ncbi:MAG: hypothetical protein C5B51_03625 [Terriglobia bacterium]|nr:MAG: hypothetical protein C5B51_03625 [Terriglobia bacterium]
MIAQAFNFDISDSLREGLQKRRRRAGLVGIVGVILLVIGLLTSSAQFYRSYLWAYIFFLGITGGSLSWLMLQHLTGGAWGVVIRRPAEAAARTLPLLVVLFIPVIFGISSLYPWSHPDLVAKDEILRHKQVFLTTPFWLLRAAVILAGLAFLGLRLNRWSVMEDQGSPVAGRKMSSLSAVGLIFWSFAVTFLSIDWVMSLNEHWFSTMFGLLFMIGQGLSGIAFLITIMVLLSQTRPMAEILTPRHLHDLGKFMLACTMVWAYFSFSQWLIIWAGNLPEEIPWYVERLRGGWQYVALLLIFGHFALPFALLLSRDLKRNFTLLRRIAIFVLCMRIVDVYWLVTPDASKSGLAPSWVDLGAVLGLGGIWLAYFFRQLEKRPLMPINNPELVEALEHGR